jgi:hypothetical protein
LDPLSLICTACAVPHTVLGRAREKSVEYGPKCCFLLDQCFPPVLPTGRGEGVECTAIILIENVHPHELACALLDLVRGYDVPVGKVVVLSSTSHLGRCGTAAYASDIVSSFGWIREAYKG